MPDSLKLLEAKKAKILAEAEARAAEIDRDMAQLQEANEIVAQIAAKYGFATAGATDSAQRDDADAPPSDSSASPEQKPKASESQQTLAIRAAEEIIRSKGKPVSLERLYDEIIGRGIRLGGQRPQNTLSAYLSNGENLQSVRKGWWWIKDMPIPSPLWSRPTNEA